MTASKILGGAALAVALGSAAGAQELRFTCYGDTVECDAWVEQFAAFEAENEGITVVTDVVPYQSILESLPVQLASGEGPDLARVTDFGGLSQYMLDVRPYMTDPEAVEANYAQSLAWARTGGSDDDGIYAIVDQLTVTGGFANKTLFDQAGVALPEPGSTWEDWAAAAVEVAEATGVDFPMAIDRSGHRFAAPAISYGAAYFGEDGEPLVVDDGFRAFSEQFVAWHEDGTMAMDVWAGSGGDTYADASTEFINGNLAVYYSGSWQIGRFGSDIGDAFDWVATGSMCGPAACTGMPGGAGIAGFKETEHPEAVGALMDFISRDEVQAAVLAQTRNIPAGLSLQEAGIDYGDAPEQVKAALAAFVSAVPEFSPVVYELQGYRNNRAIFNATPARLTQAIVGELSVDEALERLDADVAEAVAAAN
ncbi:MAG: carbohydrate ABC transporter substrate-binding protein [Rhodobacteraceae bacterium]|nr:carbohydrate ABC transporter substrate-binding protein [Paracoccaceae bacterium]